MNVKKYVLWLEFWRILADLSRLECDLASFVRINKGSLARQESLWCALDGFISDIELDFCHAILVTTSDEESVVIEDDRWRHDQIRWLSLGGDLCFIDHGRVDYEVAIDLLIVPYRRRQRAKLYIKKL